MSDSFADLWDFSAAPKSADLTIAQKTAIAEQERIDALLKNQQQRQQQQQQQQQNSSSAWDGLDSLVQPEVHGSEPLLGDEDILGDLGRPVDELRKEQAQKQAVAQPPSPPPHILGQIVEMGFSLHQARAALASTSSGQDIQAALESLIAPRRPSPPSPDPERSPPMSHTPVPKQRQRTHQDLPSEGSGTSQTDNILSQASELGFNLFNRANAAWKEGKERVQKVYGERRAAMSEEGSDSSRRNSGRSTPTRPKWMLEEVPAVPAPKSSRKEIDLLSDSSAAPVYVSKFRHAKPKVSTLPPPSLPPPHPTTSVTAVPSAIASSQNSKSSGSQFFKLGDFPAAESAYTRAIEALPAGHALLIPLYNNRALVRLKVGDVNGVLNDTGLVEQLIGGAASLRDQLRRGDGEKIKLPGSQDKIHLGDALIKAWKRRAEALEGREKWEEARMAWEKVAGAEWVSQSIRAEGAKGAGRCRNMQKQGIDPPKPKATVTPVRPPQPHGGLTPPSQALDSFRAANEATESEDMQRHALKDSVEARLRDWKGGKEHNIRALLASLDSILWSNMGIQKVSMAELVSEGQVKVRYMKAIAKVHPDKLNAGNSTVEQRMIAGGVFGALNEAWNASRS